ncbi:glycoside hydrolase family 32 protein [Haloferula sargassicola]
MNPMTKPYQLASLLCFLVIPSHAGDLVISSFEAPGFGAWETTGEAFGTGPVDATRWSALEIQGASGRGLACSEGFEAGDGPGNDAPQGHLLSPEFTVERDFIAFRIGGGDFERHCCLNLWIDGRIVKSATGRNSDRLHAESWAVSEWKGRRARIEAVDEASGRWGHLLVDGLVQTDSPEALPVVSTPPYRESLRPLFHFTARQWTMDRLEPGMRQEGWINDLNGMIHYRGEYHLFAQRWNKCWLHAISTDLVHWRELEPAFWEKTLDAGRQSGHCVVDFDNSSGLGSAGGEPPMIAFWSHADNRRHGISYSLDRGRTWRDYSQNPILEFPERDPKVFWHEPTGRWVMLLYGAGQYHFFTSSNLLDWQNEGHPIADAFECPDFFELPVEDSDERKWVLIHADGRYSTGSFDGTRFTEETPRRLCDLGGEAFYATQTFENPDPNDPRRIQLAWMRRFDGPALFPEMPFNQQLSFPCELSLRSTDDGLRLFRRPVAEIEKLEEDVISLPGTRFRIHESRTLAGDGEAYRLRAGVSSWSQEAAVVFRLRGAEVRLTPHGVKIRDVLNTQPAVSAEISREVKSVEILLDRRSLEVFVNDGEVSCTRHLIPSESGISMKVEGGPASLETIRLARLRSMWD